MAVPELPFALATGEICIAGRHADNTLSHWQWLRAQRGGNWAVKIMAVGLRSIFRDSLDAFTVDTVSFEKALACIPDDAPKVIIPIHRSYFDFLSLGYLLYTKPDIGIPMPHIAAAEEFGQMPLVGSLLARCGAFFIRRGQGRQDVELTDQITALVAQRETFEFFIEGTRSRSRQFLPPKRGVLRCLQSTGAQFALLPIAISYDRVPEEQSFADELSGQAKTKMTLSRLWQWYRRMRRGEVQLGRMHMACAPPLLLDADTDIPMLAKAINGSLQAATASSDYHLACFCQAHSADDITPEWLAEQIRLRGGVVLHSSLNASEPCNQPNAVIERSFHYQWLHLFVDEALHKWADNLALQHFAQQIRYQVVQSPLLLSEVDASRLCALLTLVFEPVSRMYAMVAEQCAQLPQNTLFSRYSVLSHCMQASDSVSLDVPVINNAIDALLELDYLRVVDKNQLQRVVGTDKLHDYSQCCLMNRQPGSSATDLKQQGGA